MLLLTLAHLALIALAQQVDVEAVRLSLIPNGMVVGWSSNSTLGGKVQYGTTPALGDVAIADSTTDGSFQHFYYSLLSNLTVSTKYYYTINDDPTLRFFTTAPADGDVASYPYTALHVADMGLISSAPTISLMKQLLGTYDLVFHCGDISYADDYFQPQRQNSSWRTYLSSWIDWQVLMEPITSNVSYMTLPGNHEVTCNEASPMICPANQRNYTAYRNRFRMPSLESGALSFHSEDAQNMWHSFQYGRVFWVAIDTESDFPASPSGPNTWLNGPDFSYFDGQYGALLWLEQTLSHAAELKSSGQIDWIIVGGHRPVRGSASEAICDACRAAFEPLFYKYNITLYLSGHWSECSLWLPAHSLIYM